MTRTLATTSAALLLGVAVSAAAFAPRSLFNGKDLTGWTGGGYVVEDGAIVCCHHGARFDLETGRPTMPALKPLARYAVTVHCDDVLVDLP